MSLLSRRQFLASGSAALAAPFFARSLQAAAPSRVLRHAAVGAGGMGWNDLQAIMSNPFVKLVAIADVDLARIRQAKEAYPEARVYQDWRRMLEVEGNALDSVNVATPDHMHAPISLAAMQLGKHVYCQKPLAHSIHETRVMARVAAERRLVTQMGIQIHSQKGYRQAVAIVRSGAIGKVREVHAWSSKKWGAVGAPPDRRDPLPRDFNWDLWLGGGAERPFVADHYHPRHWRRRLDFGTGTFGDMGCHIFDPVFEALALTAPVSVRSEGPAPDAWNWSTDAVIRYVFPGTAYTEGPTVPVTWYDGAAPKPREILDLVAPDPAAEAAAGSGAAAEARRKAARQLMGEGSIIVGTAGVLHVPHPSVPRLFPREKFADWKLPDAAGSHHWSDWAEACTGGTAKPLAPFDYSGPLTEAVLLGSVAVRFPQKTLRWNSAALRFENEPAADAFVRRTYRAGWELPVV